MSIFSNKKNSDLNPWLLLSKDGKNHNLKK